MTKRHVSGLAFRVPAALVLLAAMLLTACTSTDDSGSKRASDSKSEAEGVRRLSDNAADADFAARGSVNQVSATGAEKGAKLGLYDDSGKAVATGVADKQGSVLFRLVDPGKYRIATTEGEELASEPVEVVNEKDSLPDESFYKDQKLVKGFQYITTRDGTTLSALVTLPGPVENGPYPTVVEYSGYSPSKPPTNLIADRWDDIKKALPDGLTMDTVCAIATFACEAPDQPASLMASAMGYAVVSVNMRGTGCSGGAYDFFEPLQVLDGYDVVETVAAQPWVLNNKVGMVGLSYPGISQLFVAAANPPSLAAISPLSVYDDTARGVLAPGGIFNEGFALSWANAVLKDAEPYGQAWSKDRVEKEGDKVCADNQLLRLQNVDAVSKAKEYPYYEKSVADPLNPSLFVDRIDVPVFLTGAFQDEQTGGRFPHLFNRFTSAPVVKFSAWNGAHADGFQPANLVEWKTFLDFYVAGKLTPRSIAADLFLPLVAEEVFGTAMNLPPQRTFDDQPTFEAKKAAYEAEDPIRIRLESGAGDLENVGTPVATLDMRTKSWPLPDTSAWKLYFQPDGSLSESKSTSGDKSASTFKVTPELAKLTTFHGDNDNDLFRADVSLDWKNDVDGQATVFLSDPLKADKVLIGSASADLWVHSKTGEADLGVTLSEVRPDGKEIYIQSGTLRATQRSLTKDSTELLPVHSNLKKDSSPLPKDKFTEARVEIFPFGQIVRAGSRIRISVHTPGGDKARWSYILAKQPKNSTIEIGHSKDMPSRLVLPEVPGITGYPAALPPCPGVRAQPCRTFKDYTNTKAE